MRRRTFVATAVGVSCFSGCPSPPIGRSGSSDGESRRLDRSSERVSATFEVVDLRAPVGDEVSATFGGETATVTGTKDPNGCNGPVLDTVEYDPPTNRVSLVVGWESRHDSNTACGNASFDYRSTVTVDDAAPSVAEVIHDYEETESRTFTVERE